MNESQNNKQFKAFPVLDHITTGHLQQSIKKWKLLRELNCSAVKKRQKSAKTKLLIVSKYKIDVQSNWIDCTAVISTWYNPNLLLECKGINPKNLPIGFTCTKDRKYQYNFTDPEATDKKRYRPAAYRMPFFLREEFSNPNITVSHLCHNNWCYNWNHHVLELLEINKARNSCPAGPYCHHKVKCIIPGKFSDK